MNAPLIVNSTLPSKGFNTILQLGLKALSLAVTHAAVLGPRLPEGMVETLTNDVTKIGEVIPGAKLARTDVVAATVTQNAALEAGYTQVRQIRTAVRRAKAPAEVKRAYGVGEKVNKTNMRDVKVSIQRILDRAGKDPAEAASLGILKSDIEELELSLAAITSADAVQEQKRADAPLTTRERNRMGNRILAAVARIEGAGRIAFAKDPTTRAEFEALGGGPKAKKKPAAEQAEVAAPSMG